MSRNPNLGISNTWPNPQNSVGVLNIYFQYYSLYISYRKNSKQESLKTCWWGWAVDRCWSDLPPGGCYLDGPSLSPYNPSCRVSRDWSSITPHTFSCWSTSTENTPVNQRLIINFIPWKCCSYHSERALRINMHASSPPKSWRTKTYKKSSF